MNIKIIARVVALTALLATAVSAAPGPASGALDGVWYGLRADGLSNKVKVDHYTFLPDGRVFRGYPTEGLGQPVDWEYECRYAECGRYTRRGDQVVIRDAAVGADTVLTLDAQGVLRKPKSTQGYRPMHLLDGVRLNGTWGVFDPAGPPVVTISFTPDGRFREAGLLPYTAWASLGSDAASRAGKAVERGSGTYAVRRGTLELRYDRGPVARMMIATPPGVAPGPAAKTLHVGGATLDRAS